MSLTQNTTRRGRRSSTYHAFLEGEAEQRPNLTIITGAHATRVILEGAGRTADRDGRRVSHRGRRDRAAHAGKEVILSAGAIGSPHLLLLSGIGPRAGTGSGRRSLPGLDQPHVGKHLKDHLMCPLFFPAPGVGVSMNEIALSMGPAALRGPAGRCQPIPPTTRTLPAELQAMKQEAERRIAEWETTGRGLAASSLVDAVVFCLDRAGRSHSHDAQIICFLTGGNEDLIGKCLNIDTSRYFDDAAKRLAPDAESMSTAGQSGVAAQRGRDRSAKRRSRRSSGHPHELL